MPRKALPTSLPGVPPAGQLVKTPATVNKEGSQVGRVTGKTGRCMRLPVMTVVELPESRSSRMAPNLFTAVIVSVITAVTLIK